jgi:hypothetical protein
MENANSKSAPGLDGLSMEFIRKFWKFLRGPLFNYANCCFEKGLLTANFRAACVRLIPKKGNKKDLKNWRPISLLSNLYKIISRALNERLKKYVRRLTSRTQKGFTDARYIQEVLINVIECIGYVKKNIPAAAISMDMTKAFDTISHEFLYECYKFFNFGPAFCNMLQTVGKQRHACIILDNGTLSDNFSLDSGRPQGEILSPIQYNICNQIFLLKLELDPRIKTVFQNVFGPRTPFQIDCNLSTANKFFLTESERETDKAEGFADDANALTFADQESITAIEENLLNFEKISAWFAIFLKVQ